MAGERYSLPGLEELPELTNEMLDKVYAGFDNFLFMTVKKPGVRQFRCSECGEVFEEGVNSKRRTVTPEDRTLDSVRHKEECVCPKCHCKATVINTKVQLNKNYTAIDRTAYIAFFYAISREDVWIRCAAVNHRFSYDGAYEDKSINEIAIYHLTPNGPRVWKSFFGYFGWGELREHDKPVEPFQQSRGIASWNFPYKIRCVTEKNLEDTFLKYSGWEQFSKARPTDQILKYYCWYCRHPQLELLAKFGFYDIAEIMLEQNRDYPSFINWQAKKPWELFRLSKPQYDEWRKLWAVDKWKYSFNILKTYKRLKFTDPRDFKTAERLQEFTYNYQKDLMRLMQYIKRYDKTPRQAISYFEKISANSAGACHMCVGISPHEVCSMWLDYIRMADADGRKRRFSPYPANLKGAHDSYLTKQRLRETREKAKLAMREIKSNAERISKRYPKCEKNIAAYSKKYEWSDGSLSFVCPKSITDILYDGTVLGQCTARPDSDGKNWRYFERINDNVKFIGFVRKADKPNEPWFTIEFEPGGRVLQKRAAGDDQPEIETKEVTDFLIKWQQAVLPRLSKKDRQMAKHSKKIYSAELAELRRTGKKIYNGALAGTLLVEALEKDLLEIESAS